TIIGENTTIKGDIESDSSVKVIGRIEGNIKASGDIIVLINATIKGNVWAENLIVAGSISGDVHVKNNLHLESTARLIGDMEVHSFVTDEGAVFEGNCRMIEKPALDETDTKKKRTDFKYSKPKNTVVDEEEG
ncbi:MAG TPA: polymer-forming cytoskeletal protein, partial [Clostridia bacterium]